MIFYSSSTTFPYVALEKRLITQANRIVNRITVEYTKEQNEQRSSNYSHGYYWFQVRWSYIYLERWKTEKYLRSQLNLG